MHNLPQKTMYRADTPAYTRKNRETKGGLWHMTVNFLRTMILYIVIVVAVRIMGEKAARGTLSHRAGHHHFNFQYRDSAD